MSFEQLTFEQTIAIVSLFISLLTVLSTIIATNLNHKSAHSIKLLEERISTYSAFISACARCHQDGINKNNYNMLLDSSNSVILLCSNSTKQLVLKVIESLKSDNSTDYASEMSVLLVALRSEIHKGNSKRLLNRFKVFRSI